MNFGRFTASNLYSQGSLQKRQTLKQNVDAFL